MSPDSPTQPPVVKRIAVAVVRRGDHYLVGERLDPSAPLVGFAEFPGGKLEPGESPADAARRETLEETGLTVRILGTRLVVRHDYPFGTLELHFMDAEPEQPGRKEEPNPSSRVRPVDSAGTRVPPVIDGEVMEPRPPFRWRSRGEVLELTFPPANQALLESIRRDG
jgi:mutator protein MutT